LSKIETGRLEMIRQPFSPFVLFMETTETFRLSATEKGLELNLEIGDMPEFVVGDPKRLKQVLFNIISNAIKYTEKGSILLRADRVRGGILVEVTDTGIGIPKEALQKVFTPFFRVDQAMARRQDGSGLGLAIVKGILSALGGNIMIESHVGRGTTVMFHYPIMLEEDSSEEVAAVVSRIAANRNLKGLKALIVEDDPDSAAYLQTCLDMHGITHKHIPDADELNKLCAQIKPDLIFLDLYLPHRDGFVALRSLRENSALACKVIAQTADAFEETREHCRRAGFDGYLAKPYSPEDLLQEIRRVLGTPAIP